MRQSVLTLLYAVLATCTAFADVTVKPTFGHPYIFADRIVFTSVDGTQLIAIDKGGQLLWEMKFPGRIIEQRSGERFLVQSERDVYRIDVATGSKSQLFVTPENEALVVGFDDSFLATGDRRFDHKLLRIIDPLDHSVAWESSSIESIVQVTASTLVAVTADRKYENKRESYYLQNSALAGFHRRTGRLKWSIPLDNPTGSVVSAQVSNLLAVIERLHTYDSDKGNQRLIVLNPDTGEMLSHRNGNFSDLWPLEGSLGVLETSSGAEQAEFYICKLPRCLKELPVSLSAKEILRVRLHGEYIITAGIYDAACFDRRTGKRLWEKGQLEWSEPFEDKMIVTDFSEQDQTARIVTVDLGTGQERVLFSRVVTARDRAAFNPF